jgi:hypothetical protein
MTSPVLAPPPHETRRADPVPVAVPVRRDRPVISLPRPRRGLSFGRGPLAVSLAVHAAAAAIIVLLLSFGPTITPVERVARTEAVEYIDLDWPTGVPGDGAGIESSPASEPAAVNDLPAPRRQPDAGPLVFPGRVPTGIPAPGPSGVGEGTSGGTADGRAGGVGGASDRLRPGFRDPRLYVAPGDLPAAEKSNQERYMEHLGARIQASNDSVAGAARTPNTDWTVTDGSGRRWGLSEKGLHLGPVTIPSALVPKPTPTGSNQKREAAEREQQQRGEIQRQEDDRARREAREEAIRRARERAEAERRSKGGGDN